MCNSSIFRLLVFWSNTAVNAPDWPKFALSAFSWWYKAFYHPSQWNPGAEAGLSEDQPVLAPDASDTLNRPFLSCYYLTRHLWIMAATRRSLEVHPRKGCSYFGRIRLREGAMSLPANRFFSFNPLNQKMRTLVNVFFFLSLNLEIQIKECKKLKHRNNWELEIVLLNFR